MNSMFRRELPQQKTKNNSNRIILDRISRKREIDRNFVLPVTSETNFNGRNQRLLNS
jgi:hypothetical protein